MPQRYKWRRKQLCTKFCFHSVAGDLLSLQVTEPLEYIWMSFPLSVLFSRCPHWYWFFLKPLELVFYDLKYEGPLNSKRIFRVRKQCNTYYSHFWLTLVFAGQSFNPFLHNIWKDFDMLKGFRQTPQNLLPYTSEILNWPFPRNCTCLLKALPMKCLLHPQVLHGLLPPFTSIFSNAASLAGALWSLLNIHNTF